MEADPTSALPSRGEWEYEPKGDAFRCLAFGDGDTIDLMSKAGKPLTRYWAELVVRNDHFSGGRLPRGTSFLRPRDDECSHDS